MADHFAYTPPIEESANTVPIDDPDTDSSSVEVEDLDYQTTHPETSISSAVDESLIKPDPTVPGTIRRIAEMPEYCDREITAEDIARIAYKFRKLPSDIRQLDRGDLLFLIYSMQQEESDAIMRRMMRQMMRL